MKIENISIDKLIPYEFNNKIHDETQINRIANSIKEFGFTQPICVDGDNVVIIGHGRLEAAKKLGMKEIPCVCMEKLTPTQVKKLRILDNKLNESEYDIKNLKIELEDLGDLDIGDIELDIEDLFPDLGLDDEEGTEIEEDEAPEVSQEAKVVQEGDLFMLGNHRLLCGDSTKIEDVELLMDGKQADLLLTDPPYNVDIVGGSHGESVEERKKKGALTIKNDKMENDVFHQFLYDAFTNANMYMKDGACFYVRYASREVVNFQSCIEEAGLSVKQELIWNKNSIVMGRQDYQWKHEPCLYGWKETGSHNRYSDRKQTTVIDWNRPTKADIHPTMKPVGLFDYQIKNSSKKGEIVLDLFGGSGSTLIACEQLNRKCYMMELDSKYIEVIIKRYHNLNPNAEIKCLNRDIDIKDILQ